MEKLLDYLLYALVRSHSGSGHDALTGKTWTIVFEDLVYITLDEHDLTVIRCLYNERYERLSDEERSRYTKIFDLCV